MTNETSPRPWQVIRMLGIDNEVESVFVADAHSSAIARMVAYAENDEANARLIVDAVNERAKFEEARMEFPDFRPVIIAAGQRDAAIAERDRLRSALHEIVRKVGGENYNNDDGVDPVDILEIARNALEDAAK